MHLWKYLTQKYIDCSVLSVLCFNVVLIIVIVILVFAIIVIEIHSELIHAPLILHWLQIFHPYVALFLLFFKLSFLFRVLFMSDLAQLRLNYVVRSSRCARMLWMSSKALVTTAKFSGKPLAYWVWSFSCVASHQSRRQGTCSHSTFWAHSWLGCCPSCSTIL